MSLDYSQIFGYNLHKELPNIWLYWREGELLSAHDFDKETEKEQTLFYSLCCREDRQKLTREIPMTFNDFLRISCILFHMDFTFYETHLNELFQNFISKKNTCWHAIMIFCWNTLTITKMNVLKKKSESGLLNSVTRLQTNQCRLTAAKDWK